MPLEDLTGPNVYLTALDPQNPLDSDFEREGAAHIRGIKNTLQNSLPNVTMAYDLAALKASLDKLMADRAARVGTLIYALRTTSGYIFANGSLLLKASYPALWTFAQGNLVTEANFAANPGKYTDYSGTQFRVPNLNGLFIRSGSGYGASPIGELQLDAMQVHSHRHTSTSAGTAAQAGAGWSQSQWSAPNTAVDFAMSPDAAGGKADANETRPVNIAMWALIFAGL